MVEHNDSNLTYSKIIVYLNTGGAGRQPVHEAFAALGDDDAALRHFRREWGPISKHPLIDAQWQEWRNTLRRAWSGDAEALKRIQWWNNQYMMTSLTFSDGKLVMNSDHLLGTIHLLFLRDHSAGRTALCANPGCKQPYFIKRRATQRFCDSPTCMAYAQSQYAKKWWQESGAEQRRQRKEKARTKGKGK